MWGVSRTQWKQLGAGPAGTSERTNAESERGGVALHQGRTCQPERSK